MLTLTNTKANALFQACAPAAGPLPPRIVVRTVAALLGDAADPAASYVTFEPGSRLEGSGRSRWRLLVTTADALGHVDLEVHAPGYDFDESESFLWSDGAPEMTLHAAWVRPLRSITALLLGHPATGEVTGDHKLTVYFDAVTVQFEHGEDITIGFDLDRGSPPAAIVAAGAFVETLRRGLTAS